MFEIERFDLPNVGKKWLVAPTGFKRCPSGEQIDVAMR
jgi:hypothetical protein